MAARRKAKQKVTQPKARAVAKRRGRRLDETKEIRAMLKRRARKAALYVKLLRDLAAKV